MKNILMNGHLVLGQGAGFVEHNGSDGCQGIQKVRSFYQDAEPGGAADTGEVAQGDTDDQGAGAGDDHDGYGHERADPRRNHQHRGGQNRPEFRDA